MWRMVTQKKKTLPQTLGFRYTPEDLSLIHALKHKMGVQSVSDLIRQGLRLLATKEGVAQ